MLSKITLWSGSSGGRPQTEFEPGRVVVLVGPNNSGKSLFLRDVQAALHPNPPTTRRVVHTVVVTLPTDDEIHQLVDSIGIRDEERKELATVTRIVPGQGREPDHDCSFRLEGGRWVPKSDEHRLARLFTLFLDGATRLSLLGNVASSPPPPRDLVATIFRKHEIRRTLADHTHEAFGEYLTVDATAMQHFVVRLSRVKAEDDAQECGVEPQRSIDFHKAARQIDQFSDGVKAYTGILAAAIATNFRLILLDEPDAFLHPPLARRLGQTLGEIASKRDGLIIAATHDADFLMGAVQSNAPVTVVRLTYRGGAATSRVLPAGQLRQLMNDPLLRSTGVLEALFHAGAVVCEGDKDRVFYEECNRRLEPEDAAQDTVFLNVNGKDPIHRVIAPLRSMGIPAAAVVDLDVLKDKTLNPLLNSAFVPLDETRRFQELRVQALKEFEELRAKPDSDGLKALYGKLPPAAAALIADLKHYGIFVVVVGDVEEWFGYLKVEARKDRWLPAIFEAMGSDPDSGKYVRPRDDDVWAFIREIARWIADGSRLGLPA